MNFGPGLLWIECKQIYSCGAIEHFRQYYNYMDFSIIALYMASYTLRFVAIYRIRQVRWETGKNSRGGEGRKRLPGG